MSTMPNPWDRREGERGRPFAAFTDYCAMGGGRSIRALFAQYRRQSAELMATGATTRKPPTRRLRTIMTWCSRFDWPERAAAWDAHLRTAEEDKWAAFLDELRETERRLSVALTEKAEQMLRFPVARVTRQDEGGVTVVEPMEWKPADATRMAAEGSKLGRKAADAETAKVEVTGKSGGPIEVMGVADFTDAEAGRRLLALLAEGAEDAVEEGAAEE